MIINVVLHVRNCVLFLLWIRSDKLKVGPTNVAVINKMHTVYSRMAVEPNIDTVFAHLRSEGMSSTHLLCIYKFVYLCSMIKLILIASEWIFFLQV